MKKALINIFLVITFIIIYLLQSIFFSHFTIAGVMPNIFIILMLYIGLYMGRTMYILFIGLFYSRTAGMTYGILTRNTFRPIHRKKSRSYSYNAWCSRINRRSI